MVAPTIGADKIDSVEMQTFSSSKSATEGDSTSAVPTRTASKDMAPEHSLPEEPPNAAQRKQSNVQFAALLVPLFLAGWNDGTLGPLLPRIREHYNVGFTIVSLIFVFACIGFVGGAFLNVYVNEKFGFGKILVFGATLQVVAYALQAPAPPFPVYVLSYVINGVGLAVQDAQANGYVASLRDHAESKMGILHAAYGAGALCSPLVATQFAQMPRWSFHFLCSLGLAIINVIMTIVVFKFRTQDECHIAIGQAPGEKGTSSHSTFRQILGQRSVHILAFFILVYVGTEVTIGGWIVTYVIENRGGGPNSGYISAGFFGGLMVGRVALLWLNKKVGEWRVIFLYAALAIGLEMIVWFVPSLIGGGVAVSIVGVLLGPMYPIAMNQASRILPRWILTGSIGWIAGFGQAGSAVFPFATGALAQHYGIGSLHPLLVAMLAATVLLWAIVPRTPRKVE